MPLSRLTNEQVLALLVEQPKMLSVPGVALVLVDFIDWRGSEVAVIATVYAGNGQGISQLPVTVAGLPVIVKVEDRYSGRVIEVIDPRKHGGAWPRTNHAGPNAVEGCVQVERKPRMS